MAIATARHANLVDDACTVFFVISRVATANGRAVRRRASRFVGFFARIGQAWVLRAAAHAVRMISADVVARSAKWGSPSRIARAAHASACVRARAVSAARGRHARRIWHAKTIFFMRSCTAFAHDHPILHGALRFVRRAWVWIARRIRASAHSVGNVPTLRIAFLAIAADITRFARAHEHAVRVAACSMAIAGRCRACRIGNARARFIVIPGIALTRRRASVGHADAAIGFRARIRNAGIGRATAHAIGVFRRRALAPRVGHRRVWSSIIATTRCKREKEQSPERGKKRYGTIHWRPRCGNECASRAYVKRHEFGTVSVVSGDAQCNLSHTIRFRPTNGRRWHWFVVMQIGFSLTPATDWYRCRHHAATDLGHEP